MKNYSIKELTSMFWKSILLIIIMALIGGAFLGSVAKKKQHTTYTATRNVLISRNLNQYNKENNSNIQNSMVANEQEMMESYKEIAEDRQVTDVAREMLPNKMKKQISAQKFNNAIKVDSNQQSLVLNLKATSDSPANSVKMVNATAEALEKQLPKIQPGVGKVVPLAKATETSVNSKTTPHAKKYAAVGVALGGLVGIIISFMGITLKDLGKQHNNLN